MLGRDALRQQGLAAPGRSTEERQHACIMPTARDATPENCETSRSGPQVRSSVMQPILHLSLPVRDLAEARDFYVNVLGCRLGRVGAGGVDVWFYGLQLTLQDRPGEVLPDSQRGVRHFGVTLDADALAALLCKLERHPIIWVDPVSTDYAGTPKEQTKAKFLDPSGNVIEIKTYADLATGLQAI
jgi:extradiol dioxygenase family protein